MYAVLVACSTALAAEIPTILADAREIARSSIVATERNWRERVRYTYIERDESQRLGADGRVQSQDVNVSKVVTVDGVPFGQLVEHNGRPPSAEEKSKQDVKLQKLQRETCARKSTRAHY